MQKTSALLAAALLASPALAETSIPVLSNNTRQGALLARVPLLGGGQLFSYGSGIGRATLLRSRSSLDGALLNGLKISRGGDSLFVIRTHRTLSGLAPLNGLRQKIIRYDSDG